MAVKLETAKLKFVNISLMQDYWSDHYIKSHHAIFMATWTVIHVNYVYLLLRIVDAYDTLPAPVCMYVCGVCNKMHITNY